MLRPMRMTLRMLAPAAALLLLVGCGSDVRVGTEPGLKPAAEAPAQDVMVTCGGNSAWPASAMRGDDPANAGSEEFVPALEKIVASAGIDAPLALQGVPVEDGPWFVLARDGHAATLATGTWTADGPGEDGQVVSVERQGSGWDVRGWGSCKHLTLFPPEARMWGEARNYVTDDASTVLTVMVRERACTSGRDPLPFLDPPTVVETEDRVTVSFTSRPPEGSSTCPGNPTVAQTVALAEPLGDRTLYDGSRYPAIPVPRAGEAR